MGRLARWLLAGAALGFWATQVAAAAGGGELRCGQPVSGTFASTDNKHVWTFDGRPGQRVLIDVDGTSDAIPPSVVLFVPDGQRSRFPGDEGGFIDCQLPPGPGYNGKCEIVVKGEGGSSYELCYVNLDPNLPECSRRVACGELCRGEIASTASMEVYQFAGHEGDRVLIGLMATTGKLMPRVSVYPPEAGEYERDVGAEELVNHRVGHELGRSGTYSLVVYGDDNTTGRYDLCYANLDCPDVKVLSSGQTGELASAVDMDVYQFEILAGQDVAIQLTKGSAAVMDIYLPGEKTPYAHRGVGPSDQRTLYYRGTHTIVVHATGRGTYQIELEGNLVLALSTAEGGSVQPGGARTYRCGEIIGVTATPAENYEFNTWTGTAVDAGRVANENESTTTVTVEGNYTLQAHFVLVKRTLALSAAAGGSVAAPPGPYEHGTGVHVVAAPDPNYRFLRWEGTAVEAGAVDAKQADVTLTMNADYTLKANFALVPRTLTISWSGPGAVTSPRERLAEYPHGTVASLVAVPESDSPCILFGGWTGTAVQAGKVADPAAPNTTVRMDGDYTVQANFALATHVLTIRHGSGGSVTTPGEGEFRCDCGNRITVAAAPDRGRCFAGWTGTAVNQGKVADPAAPSTTVLVDGDYALQPNFALCPAPPQVSTGGAEDITRASATLLGRLVQDGNDPGGCQCWFKYWTGDDASETPKVSVRQSGESFRLTLTGLRCGTTYSYQAWAKNATGAGQGEIRSFTTAPPSVALTVSSNGGGTVVEPGLGVFRFCEPSEIPVRAEPTDDEHYFWCWTGSAVDAGKIPGGDVTRPGTSVYVDANDTLQAMFLRAIPGWADDVDRAARRGVAFSTSQLWDFGDRAGSVADLPPDLADVTGAAPNGQPPLPGTTVTFENQDAAAGPRWWPTDPYANSGRRGLLAVGGLRASINVWQSDATATSVWVQVVWRPYDGPATDLFPPEAEPELTLADVDPPRFVFRLLAQQYLPFGWHRSTYVWDVAPSPIQVRFTLGGRVVVDSLIVDTYTEQPAGRPEIHVDDDARHDPGPNDITISDPFENGTPARPFDSVQEAIDAAPAGATIIVHEGRYTETLRLPGKDITVTASWLISPGVHAPSIIDAGGSGPAVHLIGRQGADCVLSGLTILGGRDPSCAALLCERGRPTLSHCILCGNTAAADTGAIVVCRDSRARFVNCTVTGNRAGANGAVFSFEGSGIILRNSIVWANDGPVLDVGPGSVPAITYSDIEGGWPGLGILNANPGFADPGYWYDAGTPAVAEDDLWIMGDYHLASREGRLEPSSGVWTADMVGSPCIDAGGPASIWDREPAPHGWRVNIGAYGGTEQASKSGDVDY
jgi:hypothetical protein